MKISILKKINSSYSLKTALIISLILVILTIATTSLLYYKTHSMVMELMSNRLEDIGKTGTFLFSDKEREIIKKLKFEIETRSRPDLKKIISDIEPGGTSLSLSEYDSKEMMKSDDFQTLVQKLRQVKAASKMNLYPLSKLSQTQMMASDVPLIKYVYIWAAIPESSDHRVMRFVADADYEAMGDETGSPIGNLYKLEDDELLNVINKALSGLPSTADFFYTDEWGTFLNASVPILDIDGSVIAILGIDFNVEHEANKVRDLLILCISIVLIMIFVSFGITYIFTRYLVAPISRLKEGAERVRKRDFSVSVDLKREDELGVFADTFNSMVSEIREYSEELENLNIAYYKFVPKEFLDHLGVNKISEIKLGDTVEREMTILFSDIRSFTTISESMTPTDNFDFLNSYLKNISPIIRSNDGFIDKYIGDAIMALFPEAPDEALRAAIEMRRQLRFYNEKMVSANKPSVDIGIGIHTGRLMLGTIGEEERMQTTVISDSVNLASRLQDLTKKMKTPVIISEETLSVLKHKTDFHYRFLGRVKVKGKSNSIAIYEVFNGESDEKVLLRKKTTPIFEEGLKLFYEGKLGEACGWFNSVLQIDSMDYPAQMYLEKCGRVVKK